MRRLKGHRVSHKGFTSSDLDFLHNARGHRPDLPRGIYLGTVLCKYSLSVPATSGEARAHSPWTLHCSADPPPNDTPSLTLSQAHTLPQRHGLRTATFVSSHRRLLSWMPEHPLQFSFCPIKPASPVFAMSHFGSWGRSTFSPPDDAVHSSP